MLRWLLPLLVSLLVMPATADVFRPAYLQLKQVDGENYQVLWKVPALDEQTTLKVRPVFPEGTRELGARSSSFASGALVQRWKIEVPGGLEGRPIAFSGLSALGLDVLVRAERLDGSEQLARILPVEPTFLLKPGQGPLEVVSTYTVLGFEHILIGLDHLLFVFALILLVRSPRQLILTVTAFTIAHSITLALATLDIVQVPGPPVEAMIALSIVFVAQEILARSAGHAGLATRKPWLVAFSFGLLHGLGFAGALAEVGLPHNAIPLALLFFNVGVELGQLAFIGAVLAVAALLRWLLRGAGEPRWAAPLQAYLIGGVASYWLLERIAAFWA
ncbi:HupE/UreJ family protein [Pseudomonas sp. N040]|uniref:HupE/UreJ family protein n=1 Tax=Pseudomonas sp. N040 TaxID=2785325 RepID=UPI0018A2513A|nr:HupE/UreJ family protein [Pseudomonas sp. N040]MBF7730090.1 HupE/UreJ family protein [Pseudomonas sp. N040]MBW7013732.1 HupE/UreJ family protein [Pseudomonas sp. N040]